MGTQQQFCLRWNNHQNNMIDVFGSLLSNESFVDVTLACDGATLKAHKMVLSACSSFFQEIFINNPCKHPVIIMKDITLNELKAILEFMYRGEVNVSQDQLSALLKTAESLKVKGLAEVTNEHQAQENQPMNRQTASISTSNSQQMNKNRLIKNSLVRGPPSSIKSPAAKRFRQRRSSGSNSQQNISQEAEHSDFHDNREFVEAPVPHQTEPELSEDAPQKLLPNNAEDVDVKPTICVKDSPVNSPDVEQVDNSQDFVYSSFMDQSLVDEHQNTVEENSRSDGNNTYQDSGEANDEILPPYDSNMDQSSSIGNISELLEVSYSNASSSHAENSPANYIIAENDYPRFKSEAIDPYSPSTSYGAERLSKAKKKLPFETISSMDEEKLYQLKSESTSVMNFSSNLMARLFRISELQGTSVCGRSGATLDTQRMDYIYQCVMRMFPVSEEMMKSQWSACIRAMNKKKNNLCRQNGLE